MSYKRTKYRKTKFNNRKKRGTFNQRRKKRFQKIGKYRSSRGGIRL